MTRCSCWWGENKYIVRASAISSTSVGVQDETAQYNDICELTLDKVNKNCCLLNYYKCDATYRCSPPTVGHLYIYIYR